MKIKSGKLISFLSCTVALLIFFYGLIHSSATTAQPSFVNNLPAGYTPYSGQLATNSSCTCSTGGISGAPPPILPPCDTTFCYGSSSNTIYGWFSTTAEGINSTLAACERPPCFQLDGDDAVVVSGTMSPIQDLTYYSFTIYQGLSPKNHQSSTRYTPIQSSVNLGVNNSNLKTGFNGQYVLIVAANTNTLEVIKNSLRTTGVPDPIINSYLIPASVANVGTSNSPDQLSFLLRLTPQSEAEIQQVTTFVQQTLPTTEVFFIKGPGVNGDVTFDDLPQWEDTLRVNDIEYKTGLDQQLTALEQAVTSVYAQQGYSVKARLTESLVHVDPNECRATSESCKYDSPDALYTGFPCDFSPISLPLGDYCNIQLGTNSDDVLMLLGVDHSLVGAQIATYFSEESEIVPGSKDGTFSFVGLYTQGSATPYLPSLRAAKLYAVKIARSCGSGELYCAAVPYLGETQEKTGFYTIGRIYLDKVTDTAPNPANLLPGTLLWFTRNE